MTRTDPWKEAVHDALVVDWCLNEQTAKDPRAVLAFLDAPSGGVAG